MVPAGNMLYKRIETYLLDYIKTRNLQPGDRLPPERAIGRQFNASHVPVRQATDALVEEGILERVHGKGTYVKRLDRGTIKTNTIGVLYWPDDVSFYQSPFYAAILGGIKLQAEREEQKLVYRSLWGDYQAGRVHTGINEMMNEVDGFLVMEMIPDMREKMVDKLLGSDKPVVVVADNLVPNTIDAVVFDHVQNTRDAVQFLVDKGHRQVCYVYQESKIYDRKQAIAYKLKAYNDTLEANHIQADPGLVISLLHDDEQQGLRVFSQLMKKKDRPTAMYCHDDGVAFQVYALAMKAGLKVPGDLSIMGCDDMLTSERSYPRLTTTRLPFMELGLVGMRRLLEKLREEKEGVSTTLRISLPGKLVLRETHRDVIAQ